MVRRAYLFVLSGFVAFVLSLNAVTFFTGASLRQATNIFYLTERTVAVMLLFEHIVFESGVILYQPSEEEIKRAIWDECSGTSVDPELVALIVGSTNRRLFRIDFDGSIGLMRLKSYMLHDMMGVSPFILSNNIKAGVAYLNKLMEKERRMDVVLREYFKPVPSKTVFDRDIRAANEHAMRIFTEYSKVKPQNKLQYEMSVLKKPFQHFTGGSRLPSYAPKLGYSAEKAWFFC